MTDIIDTHPSWCGETCDATGEDPVHTTDRTYAAKGGPVGDPESDFTVDRVPTVSVSRYYDSVAEVVLQPEIMLRLGTQWGTPGDLFKILPEMRMSETRARLLADLLIEHADRARAINDGGVQ